MTNIYVQEIHQEMVNRLENLLNEDTTEKAACEVTEYGDIKIVIKNDEIVVDFSDVAVDSEFGEEELGDLRMFVDSHDKSTAGW